MADKTESDSEPNNSTYLKDKELILFFPSVQGQQGPRGQIGVPGERGQPGEGKEGPPV